MFLKRKLIKELKDDYIITNGKHCDFTISSDETTYHVLIIKTSKSTQLTINSPKIWEVATGSVDGIRYKKTSSTLMELKNFNQLKNRVVYLTMEPYKIFKYLNESDIIDVSDKVIIDGINIIKSMKDLRALLK